MHKKSKSERTERTKRAARAAQAEILAAIQQTGNNIAEVMNSLQALGAKFGINVNFMLRDRETEMRGRHSEHGKHQAQTQRNRQISKVLQYKEDKAQEVTIPELAAMVSDELGMNEDCAFDALETAFELMERYSLILDIGDIGILAGHDVQEVHEIREPFADCEDFEDCCEDCSEDCCEDCEACENFTCCDYCSEDEDEDSYENDDNDVGDEE